MDKLLYISTGIPKEEADNLREKQYDFSSNALLPISVFHGNLLSGLAESYDQVDALCGVPINHRLFKVLRYNTKTIEKGNIRYCIPGFFNFPGVKQLTTIVKLWWNIFDWCKKNRKHNCSIIIDGTFYTGLISLAIASKLYKVKTAAILVDYYSFMDPIGQSRSQKQFYKLIKCIDRFVFVTDYLGDLVNRDHKPYMIMEGLVSVQLEAEKQALLRNDCVYAGGLHEIYGVKNLVAAFHESDLPYEMHFYGNGNLVDYIKSVSQQDPRIQYKGILSHDELLAVERGAKLLINPRPVYGELDTRYNFPSKLMEYMQSGRPVITTRLLGIPEEYNDYMYYFENDSVEGLKRGLEKVLSLEESELKQFALRAKSYVNDNKNNITIGRRIHDFMNQEGRHEGK